MNSKADGRPPQLVVVSNRLPYDLPREGSKRGPRRNVGGLVNALEPVLAGGRGAWLGWDGVLLGSSSEARQSSATPRTMTTDSGIEICGVPLSEREIRRYYHGLSNRTLWPLFHNILDKSVFNSEDWTTYAEVNKRFALTALGRIRGRGDRIWVHDYQLMLVPRFLREMHFRGRIDFFLHIPFPAPELFLSLPWRRQLIEGLLSANTVGFHVASYRDNFLRVVERMSDHPCSIERRGDQVVLRHRGGTTIALVAPIGIDVAEFERLAGSPRVEQMVARLRRVHGPRLMLFSADRLDYTKGITERLLAVERYLQTHRDRAGRFVLVQVVVPSRSQVDEYRTLKREIDQHVGRINGAWGREGWNPIHYEYRAMDREELVAHYRVARAALVTPLRDGMNLVAPEFIASRIDNDGVLVLSEFAGVSEQLGDALKVNPYDLDACASAIGAALEMPPAERSVRMSGLRNTVRQNTVNRWAALCLGMEPPVPASIPDQVEAVGGRPLRRSYLRR